MNADINRRLENLIRFGTIKTVNPSKPIPLVTVDLDDIVTPEIRFLMYVPATTRLGIHPL